MAWIVAHYKDVVLAILSIDAVLIPILPKVQILVKIKDFLSALIA